MTDKQFNLPGLADLRTARVLTECVYQGVLDTFPDTDDPEMLADDRQDVEDLMRRLGQFATLLELAANIGDEIEEMVPRCGILRELMPIALDEGSKELVEFHPEHSVHASDFLVQGQNLAHLDAIDEVDFVEPGLGEIERRVKEAIDDVPPNATLADLLHLMRSQPSEPRPQPKVEVKQPAQPTTKRDLFNALPTELQDLLLNISSGNLDDIRMIDGNTGRELE